MLAILLWIWFSQSAELREETSKSITLKAEQTQKNNQENIQNNHREKTADELLLESMYGGYYFNTIN